MAFHVVFEAMLVDFDKKIDLLDRAVFEAAAGSNMDAQRDCAMCPRFQPPVKEKRDLMMKRRNAVANLLGFRRRKPHDFSPRDYVVRSDGVLVPQ